MNEPTMSSSPVPSPKPGGLLRKALCARTLIHVLFWSWHGIWVLGVMFGVAPEVLPPLLVDSIQGQVPWGITLSAIGLTLLPAATMWAGWHLRHDHWKLFRLFYGVGGVAFSLLFVRLFFIREATGAVDLLLATLAAGGVFYLAELFGGLPRLGRAAAVVRMVGYSALLIIGVYVGVTMGLYALPGIVLSVPEILEGIVELFTRNSLLELMGLSPFFLAFLAFLLYSFTLLLGLPLAVTVLYTRGYWRGLRAWSAERPLALGVGITTACVGAWLLAFVGLTHQPQREAFERLEAPPASMEEQQDHLAHAERIRAGLLNAYLAPHRYWGAREGNVQLARLYRKAFGTDQDVMGPQVLFDAFAAPLLYDGRSMGSDRALAEIRYEQFFDRPLQEGDRQAVLDAVSATYDRDRAEAGLLDVGRQRVLLTEQELSTEVHGDIARFTLHEVYENQTWDQQEILYYFNLPEHAAITGLWLGDGDGGQRRFAPVVAPRGAAQQVYREQVARRVDPALIEQVGPRQYRLRAFPIPARDERRGGKAPAFHLWLEWTVLGDGEGWPLPRLAEARNVYWDEDQTERLVDGAPSEHDGWLPARVDRRVARRAHQLELGGFRVRATPSDDPPGALPRRLAVILETSLSMQDHAEAVQEVRDELASRGVDADLFLAPSPYGAEQPRRVPLTGEAPHYYGGHTLAGALAQFEAVRGDTSYDAVVVLSDAGSFAFLQDDAPPTPPGLGRRGSMPARAAELEDHLADIRRDVATVEAMQLDAPVWMLHFGGLPHAYRDEVGDLLQRTHGGVATDLDELLRRLGGGPTDGYRWSFEPLDAAPRPTSNDAFAPVAARALVAHWSRQLDLETLDGLDAIHVVAVDHRVVTPWSSMIVLVDEAQQEALRRASEAEDRFEREAENGVESTTTPFGSLELAATPEPEEWLLLCLAFGVVVVRMRWS